ncbi:MAG: HAMP domain-containing sensor histidine kinase [Burkholderiaceae bacterium]
MKSILHTPFSIEPFEDAGLESTFQRSYRAAGLQGATLAVGLSLLVLVAFELIDRIGPRVAPAERLGGLLTPRARLFVLALLALSLYLGLRHRQRVLDRYTAWMSALSGALLLALALPVWFGEPLARLPLRPVIAFNLLIFFVFAFLRLPTGVAFALGGAGIAAHVWTVATWYGRQPGLLALIAYPIASAAVGWLLSRTIERRERRLYLAATLTQGAEADKAQRIDEFVHDLRGPLAALDAEMHHVVRQAPRLSAEEIDQRMRSMADELDWVRDHLEELSRWNKGDDPRAPLKISALPLRLLVDWVRAQFAQRCREQGIDLQIAVDADLEDRLLSTHRTALFAVVMNLVGNAIKYRNPDGVAPAWVRIEFSEQDSFCVIRISDNGIGISADEMPRIWEPGFRSARSRALSEGSGLGLAITRERIHRMAHHSLTARSTQGRGSQFTLRVPWHRSDGATLIEPAADERGTPTLRRGARDEPDELGAGSPPHTLTAAGSRGPVSRVLLLAADAATLARISRSMDPHNAFVDEASSTKALQALLQDGDSTYDYMVIGVTRSMNVKGMIETVRVDHGFDVPAIVLLPWWRYLKIGARFERQLPELRCGWIGVFGGRALRRRMRAALSRSLALQARIIRGDG